MYPELETDIKLFVEERAKSNTCDLNLKEIANYVTKRFYEIHEEELKEDSKQVRSLASLSRDLEAWGFKYQKNSLRPYFAGHEREDVIKERENFVDHFFSRKCHYYTIDSENNWVMPIERPWILAFHDESNFRSGEQSSKRFSFCFRLLV